MEFYDNYIARLETEGSDPELLEELRQEAMRSLMEDSPGQALTQTGQMVAAMLVVTQQQNPLQRSMVDAINSLTTIMADYLEHLGWRQWAVKTDAGWKYERLPPSG